MYRQNAAPAPVKKAAPVKKVAVPKKTTAAAVKKAPAKSAKTAKASSTTKKTSTAKSSEKKVRPIVIRGAFRSDHFLSVEDRCEGCRNEGHQGEIRCIQARV